MVPHTYGIVETPIDDGEIPLGHQLPAVYNSLPLASSDSQDEHDEESLFLGD